MNWSRSVWLFCLDITYGQSREGHVFDHVTFWLDHVSWSDRCVHGLNMTRCIEQYKSQLQADHDLASSDRFIRHRSLAPALTATCPLFPCMSVGHACRQCDVRVMILQYRRWSVPTTCPSYTHANSLVLESGLSFSMATDDPRRREDTRMDMEGRPHHPQ